ncbi:MAG TPA: PIN domain-containing protein [Candidatus Angelobacter sp.]|nr:PIN domain-containing protein [Candidatus Angelobacter sp.]
MLVAIADTHAAIWYLFSDSRLGAAASAFIDNAISNGDHIGASAISVAEMIYLIEKGRIPANAFKDLHAATADPKAVLQHVPLHENIAMKMKMSEVSRQDVPDLPDRVIAATARFYDVPVLSRDHRIQSSIVQTIW